MKKLKSESISLKDLRKFKRKQKLGHVARSVIQAVSSAGFLTAAIMAPNVVQLWDNKLTRQKEWYMRNVLQNLSDRDLLQKTKRNGRVVYELTKRGEGVALAYELQTLTIPRPILWDGKWRIVISDIKESNRLARDELRDVLSRLGFAPIQKSVWAHPYKCADVISIVKRKFGLDREVLYMEVDTLENDHWLRDIFFLR